MVNLPCLEWDYATVRYKLRPLLIEWDVRQGPDARAGELKALQTHMLTLDAVQLQVCRQHCVPAQSLRQWPLPAPGVEWRPTAIQKAQCQKGGRDSAWRYVLNLERLQGGSAQVRLAGAELQLCILRCCAWCMLAAHCAQLSKCSCAPLCPLRCGGRTRSWTAGG